MNQTNPPVGGSNSKNEKEEKKEFLKRKEIRTMQKDIARLREIEAEKERERIAALKLEEEEKRLQPALHPSIPPSRPEKEEAPSEDLIPKPLPKKPSPFKKILTRGIIIVVLFLIFSFFYWFFGIREPPAEEIILPAEEAITLPAEEIILPEEEKPETPEEEIPIISQINERILDWGYYVPTTPRTIDAIIVHSVYNALEGDVHSIEGVIQEYEMYRVAAHYLIARDGAIYRLAPDEAVAYHAGASKMADGRVNVNDFSIGIEVIYTKTESPDEVQYQTLAQLVKYLRQQHNIPFENILGHKDIAPERKTDPWNFDWEYFYSLIE